METAYKLRFVPLAISLPTLAVVLALKYGFGLPLDGTLKFALFLALASLFFLHTMRDWKKRYAGKPETPDGSAPRQDAGITRITEQDMAHLREIFESIHLNRDRATD